MPELSRSAELRWDGDTTNGTGVVAAGSGAFSVAATYPTTRGEPAGHTTPEELLAASHAACYGIGLRSLIARRGGSARRVTVTATVTAEKGPAGIRLLSSHLTAMVEAPQGIGEEELQAIARETKDRCTISIAISGNVEVSFEVRANDPRWLARHPPRR